MVGSSLTDWTQIQFTRLMLFDIEMRRALAREGQRQSQKGRQRERRRLKEIDREREREKERK